MWGSMPNIHDNQNHQPVHNMSMSNGFYEQYQTNGQPMSSQPSSTFQMQYYQLEGSFQSISPYTMKISMKHIETKNS